MRRAIVPVALLLLVGCTTRSATTASRPPATEQRFPDPKAAVDALVAACRTNDEPALVAIFGPEARTLVSTGDPERDRERCRRFVAASGQMTRLDPKGADTLELVVGNDDFPFPIPLVRDAGGWRFDTEQGAEEVLRRRVGADELEAIAVCRAYGRTREQPPGSWWGYNFRVTQGKDALVAYPVAYGSTGIMTFIAGSDGRVYEKDLGDKTDKVVGAMKSYDPDATWKLVAD